jgi:signal peptidase I
MQNVINNRNFQQRIRRAHIAREIVEVVLLVAVITIAIKVSIETYSIADNFMEPNYKQGQLVMANRFAYAFGSPQRGDVVVFSYPYDTSKTFITRIIGVPGDTITLDPLIVKLNDKLLAEPYINQPTNPTAEECVLGKDDYFAMNDNRKASSDSRTWGVLNRKYIIGKATFIYWPFPIKGIDTYSDTFKDIPTHQPPNQSYLKGNPTAPVGNCKS